MHAKRYNKKSNLSYAFGVYPTLELLKHKVKDVVRVILHPKGMQNRGVLKILNYCRKLNLMVDVDQRVFEKLALSDNLWALAVFTKYQTSLIFNNNHVVLINPSDMGNLGTICRSMLAFGFFDLALVTPAVDIFDPKVGRASMGAVYGINFEYFNDFKEYQRKYHQIHYVFTSRGRIALDEVVFTKPYALIFGNEGGGLPQGYENLGQSVKIPQTAKVDSLNLATAVSIALYKARVCF